MHARTLAIPLAVLATTLTLAQPGTTSPEIPRQAPIELIPPDANQDIAAIQSRIDALYAVISGPAGDRDWDRFKSLFADNARLSQIFHRPAAAGLMTMTPDEFAQRSAEYLKTNAFYETELASRIDHYAGITHAWSTYESRRDPAAEPFTRGINSIQLVKPPGQTQWKILAVTWDSEASGIPIPVRYTQQ